MHSCLLLESFKYSFSSFFFDDKMAELKIEIPDKLEKKIKESGIRLSALVKRLVKQLEEEKEMTNWSVKLQRASRRGRLDRKSVV